MRSVELAAKLRYGRDFARLRRSWSYSDVGKIFWGFVIGLTLIVSPTIAAPTEGNHEIVGEIGPGQWTRTTDGCEVWSFTTLPPGVVSWSGKCVDGRIDGEGDLQNESNGMLDTYHGGMRNGMAEEHGILRRHDGKTIEGDFHQGTLSGHVLFTDSNGFRYDGQWDHGGPEGYGSAVWPGGRSYEGEWITGSVTGEGKMKYADGRLYEGHFRDGNPDGEGSMVMPDGSRLEGSWKMGLPGDGHVSFSDPAGNHYDGDSHGGKKSGMGTMVKANGNRYQGDFLDNKEDGNGVYTWANGDRYDGSWRSSLPDGQGTFVRPNDRTYIGVWSKVCLRFGEQTIHLFVEESSCRR
jgi:hypothetical protein